MAMIDPRLVNALEAARSAVSPKESTVQAVVTLRSDDPNKPMNAKQTTESVNRIVEEVARQTNKQPDDLVIFPNIQSFSIAADAEVIDKILDVDSVDTASLDQ